MAEKSGLSLRSSTPFSRSIFLGNNVFNPNNPEFFSEYKVIIQSGWGLVVFNRILYVSQPIPH